MTQVGVLNRFIRFFFFLVKDVVFAKQEITVMSDSVSSVYLSGRETLRFRGEKFSKCSIPLLAWHLKGTWAIKNLFA